MNLIANPFGIPRENDPNPRSFTHALRSDVERRFVYTHRMWPTNQDRVIYFKIMRNQEKLEFPQYFSRSYGHDFRCHLHLIDIKDNCLDVEIYKDRFVMWLPKESLTLIRKFYNYGYMINLSLKYIGEAIFFWNCHRP
ncbi:hypothetical protein PIB30_056553 [Stylosanthes scabra]|uniref:Uncharacterized protein n=1 Tax=Stylosanthes scabra TaxID=79078 RepID=A0ABU6WKK5_9FABA|nr:hypothetical protein [Stylosanthes scabra]